MIFRENEPFATRSTKASLWPSGERARAGNLALIEFRLEAGFEIVGHDGTREVRLTLPQVEDELPVGRPRRRSPGHSLFVHHDSADGTCSGIDHVQHTRLPGAQASMERPSEDRPLRPDLIVEGAV